MRFDNWPRWKKTMTYFLVANNYSIIISSSIQSIELIHLFIIAKKKYISIDSIKNIIGNYGNDIEPLAWIIKWKTNMILQFDRMIDWWQLFDLCKSHWTHFFRLLFIFCFLTFSNLESRREIFSIQTSNNAIKYWISFSIRNRKSKKNPFELKIFYFQSTSLSNVNRILFARISNHPINV